MLRKIIRKQVQVYLFFIMPYFLIFLLFEMEYLNAVLFKRENLESVPKIYTDYIIHLKITTTVQFRSLTFIE